MSFQFAQHRGMSGMEGFPVLRSGDMSAEPASQGCEGAVAVGTAAGSVIVSSRAVEDMVVCPEDQAFPEFLPQRGQGVEVWQLVEGDQVIIVQSCQDLSDFDNVIETIQELPAVAGSFA